MEDLHASFNFSTSTKLLMFRLALISSGSNPNVRAAHRAKVVFPIPGVPVRKTLDLYGERTR
jgi:hypothetical protein